MLIETTGLTKRYGDTLAVDGVDLAVREGEVYGFLGPNGAGKTTTMRMLLGLIRPTSGRIVVLGRGPGDPAGLARVGSMVENPGFYPYLSGRDNLRVVAKYAGVPKSRIDGVLATVDLADRAGDRFSKYSLGMKQRLGVAAALLKDPDLLILDEPSNGLDPAGMAEMRTLIRTLAAEGRTVMLSSHVLGEVQQVCDRVGVISHGRMIAESTVDELRGSSGVLHVVASPVDDAVRTVSALVGAELVHETEDGLRVDVEPDRAAWVNRALVTAGVDVSVLRPIERSLEEVFLEMTGQEEVGSHVG